MRILVVDQARLANSMSEECVQEARLLHGSCVSSVFNVRANCRENGVDDRISTWFSERDLAFIEVVGEITPEFEASLDHHEATRLHRYGIYAGRHIPLITQYGLGGPMTASIFTGSWLYGIADGKSDFDLRSVSIGNSHRECRTEMLGSAAFSTMNQFDFGSGLMCGDRHCWELAAAPKECRVSSPAWDEIDNISNAAKQRVPREAFLTASVSYIKKYAPHLLGYPVHEGDINLRRWKISNGWAYKLGYYMLIDVALAEYAFQSGSYNTRLPLIERPQLRDAALRCKRGIMTYHEWRLLFDIFAHKQARQALEECQPS